MRPMPELKTYELPTATLVPYARNAKTHTQKQVDEIAASIEEFGFNDPVGVWENANGEPEIVEGHGRVLAAKKLGLKTVPVLYLNHLDDEQRRAYGLVHNKLTMNTDFDIDALTAEIDSLNLDMTEWGFDDFGMESVEEAESGETSGLSEAYSQNLGKITYEPKNTEHSVSDLYEYNTERFAGLLDRIRDNDLKKMLELRMAWFIDFKFASIADYYAYQASPEEQRAFEALGLVLLDKDQLIENGFADIVGAI